MNGGTTRSPDTPSWRRIASEDKRLDPSGSGYALLVADIEWGSTAGPFAARKRPPHGGLRVKMNAWTTRSLETPSWRRIARKDEPLDNSGSGYAFLATNKE